MTDTWQGEAQRPLGEMLFEDVDLDDVEFEIIDATDEMSVVPLSMYPLTPEQKQMIRFMDGLNWDGLTQDRKRQFYERCLRDVIKKRSWKK